MRSIGAVLAAAALAAAVATVTSTPADAYTVTGCRFASNSKTIITALPSGNFTNAIVMAIDNYNVSTEFTLARLSGTAGEFTARTRNAGATGWEGLATWVCPTGIMQSVRIELNEYYVPNSTDVYRLKVLWLHEIGHALGLGHAAQLMTVMWPWPSDSYAAGVTGLTLDEVMGVNALY